jgi:hypothetical protein
VGLTFRTIGVLHGDERRIGEIMMMFFVTVAVVLWGRRYSAGEKLRGWNGVGPRFEVSSKINVGTGAALDIFAVT